MNRDDAPLSMPPSDSRPTVQARSSERIADVPTSVRVSSDGSADTNAAEAADLADIVDTSNKPRGLWALMGAPAATAAPVATAPTVEPIPNKNVTKTTDTGRRVSLVTDNEDDLLDEDGHELDDDVESTTGRPKGLLLPPSDHVAATKFRERVVKRCYAALTLGIVALCLAPLNLLPWMAVKVPGVIIGLIAVFIGHQSASDARRCSDYRRLMVLSVTAVGLGIGGMMSGPLGLNALGSRWQQAALQRGVTDRLQAVGSSINEYHNEFDRYPIGGTVARDADGTEIGMHSWMTSLLPYLNHGELYQRIDLKQPYDHASNRSAMKQVVPTFLVPNVTHQPNAQGLATTHFAGLGGQTNGPNGVVNFGVFERNVTIRRSDVTDGLSQTMIVGEIAQQLPAWGDPENWREIDQGLNRQALGFGNKDGTGAHFLFADGSVRFFPNSTSKQVLEQLSTRDGRESQLLP